MNTKMSNNEKLSCFVINKSSLNEIKLLHTGFFLFFASTLKTNVKQAKQKMGLAKRSIMKQKVMK